MAPYYLEGGLLYRAGELYLMLTRIGSLYGPDLIVSKWCENYKKSGHLEQRRVYLGLGPLSTSVGEDEANYMKTCEHCKNN